MQKFDSMQVEAAAESDFDLVARIRSGDQLAVRKLFRTYYSSLCRFTYRLVDSREDAEDIVESIFEKMWLNRATLDPSRSIKSYLFKAAQNQAVDWHKLKANNAAHFENDDLGAVSYSDPAQEAMEEEFAEAIKNAIEKLPERCKLVFTLNRQEGLTYAEIADVMGISVRTVENQIVRAMKHLKRALKDFRR